MQQKNTIIFLVSSFLILIGWFALQRWLNPPPPRPKQGEEQVAKDSAKKKPDEKVASGWFSRNLFQSEAKKKAEEDKTVVTEGPTPPPPRRRHGLVTLSNSESFLQVILDPRGGGVHSIIFSKFEKADGEGRPVPGEKLELVPAERNEVTPSYLLYHYRKDDPERPLDTLGREEWEVDEKASGPGKVVFTYDKLPDVKLTKTYQLEDKEYHITLKVKIEPKQSSGAAKEGVFQYQLTSGHGLPIEGKWYTGITRNALVGQVKGNDVERDLQDLKHISGRMGGDPVQRKENYTIRYAGVVVQYFASLIVVPPPGDGETEAPLVRAQATVESAAVRGKYLGGGWNTIKVRGTDEHTYEFLLPPLGSEHSARKDLLDIEPGHEIVVRYEVEDAGPVATQILSGEAAKQLAFDDIGVRVVTKEFPVPANGVEHTYLLYNGPVKVRLLADKGVAADTVDMYKDKLHLKTLTDYHSSGFFGNIASAIYWTELLIACTNLMHVVLGLLHTYVMPWSYGLCIILLTILVRGMMFPLSRKQALTSMRMQSLAPEIKKLQEKYKEDRQALGMAQMELYRKHGINPLGSCWVLLLQMPIFLGLYYALQESIDFRLAEFLWIKNLAAPDMLVAWTKSIPWISTPESYGGWIYLGPYFNLLPVIAVGLMIVQQSFLMPPPTDEQQAMQQKMMKYMMIIFGIMFYKVAAGLCLYFIASSVWGFTERKLLPKRKPGSPPEPLPERKGGLFHRLLQKVEAAQKPSVGNGAAVAATAGAVPAGQQLGGGKRKKRKGRGSLAGGSATTAAGTDGAGSQERSWWTGLREWWAEVLRKAEKK